MTTTSDRDYYARRLGEELAKAERADSFELQHVHRSLANLYRIRLEALPENRHHAAG